MGTDTSTTKEYPTLSSTAAAPPPPPPHGFNGANAAFRNGDHKGLYDNRHSKADFRDAFADPASGEFFPEDIPGIPKYRPSTAGGDFAERYDLGVLIMNHN